MNKLRVKTDEIPRVAKDFVGELALGVKAQVFGLAGNLGSGKTTFTQAVAKALGVNEGVTSPTFVIEKIYKLSGQVFDRLIHIDAYRLESGRELLQLGWHEISSDPKNLIMIEWPERVADILPADLKKINFAFIDEKTREIEFE